MEIYTFSNEMIRPKENQICLLLTVQCTLHSRENDIVLKSERVVKRGSHDNFLVHDYLKYIVVSEVFG